MKKKQSAQKRPKHCKGCCHFLEHSGWCTHFSRKADSSVGQCKLTEFGPRTREQALAAIFGS